MNPTVSQIKKATAGVFGIDALHMTTADRRRVVARPRQVAMYLSRQGKRRSLPAVAGHFRRDHTTVLHAIRRVEAFMAESIHFAVRVHMSAWAADYLASFDCIRSSKQAGRDEG